MDTSPHNSSQPASGVGPHPLPWPTDDRYDQALLAAGDTRNVIDKYRYWTIEAITADLDRTRSSLHIAIENWEHDLNIGTVVRTANAFNVGAVHIIGKKHWNRRGAMVTDRYLHIFHHKSAADFAASVAGRKIIAIDNLDGASPLASTRLPEQAVLVFGSERAGISDELRAHASRMVFIEQQGSTRSLNAASAAAIAMYAWQSQHVLATKQT